MKKITQNLRWLVTLLAMIVCTGAWAETSIVSASKVTSSSASWTGSANETWAVTIDGGALNQNVTNEFAQIGTKNSPSTSITFSTSGISETITKIEVECASYNGLGTISATVGSEAFGTQGQSIPTWSSNSGGTVTFYGSASGEIVITMTNGTGGRAMYIKSITVTYSNSGETPTPSITIDPATVNATAEETDGTLAISYDNLDISSTTSFGIQYYNASNEEIDKPDWIVVEVESEEAGVSYMISYVIDANEGEARTAYCKVYAMGDEDFIYSNLITINQAEYVAPSIATLPFVFDGGRADIEDTEGLTQEGLDSDYGSSPKLKFNSTGDWVLLQFDEVPGDLSFDIKGNTFSGGTFTVQTSSDGETYTDLKNYTVSNLGTSTQTETFDNLSSDVRYIKWIYTEKASGNVALGNIQLKKAVPQIIVTNTSVDVDANKNSGTLEVTYKTIDPELAEIHFYAEDGETSATYDWIDAEFDGDNNIEYHISANEGEARTAYLKVYGLDAEANDVYSGLITINQAAYVAPLDVVYKKVTKTTDITDGQYLIVYEDLNVAFDGSLTTLDAAGNTIDVEINDDNTISGTSETEAAEFTINVTEGSLMSASGKYIGVSSWGNGIKPSDTSDYKNSFAIEEGNAIISIEFSSGNMILNYNSDSNQKRFRYYKNGSQQPIQLYKKVVEEENITIGSAGYATYVTKKAIKINPHINAYAVLAINETKTSVALDKLTEVPASTPIIVEGAEGEYPCTVIENAESPATNLLKVSTGVTGDGATFYALANKDQGVGFYPVGNGIEVPAGKAYLEIPPTMSVKGFLALGGLADAINNIAVENANGTIFNIAGQKVQNITKGGLYIVNGKKVFVK